MAPPTAAELLRDYVERHNRGVRTGDFSALVTLFGSDAALSFTGRARVEFRGRNGIADAFDRMAPTDELELDAEPTAEDANRACAFYRWTSGSGRRDGAIRLTAAEGRIATLSISV